MVVRTLHILTLCAVAPAAWGCATCFGDASSAQTQGMNMGIAMLLGVTGLVVGCMGAVTVAILLRMRRVDIEAAREDEKPPVPMEAEFS